jgi:hypothetical protein
VDPWEKLILLVNGGIYMAILITSVMLIGGIIWYSGHVKKHS